MKHVKTKMVGDVAVLYPKGYFAGGDETDELRDALLKAFDDGKGKCVVNLHDTTHLTSAGIGTLAAAHTHYVRRGGRICISNVNDRIKMLLVIVHLIKIFEPYETEAAAVESFKNWKPPEVPEEIAATERA